MSTSYHGRRAPNVSQYLANLNTIPTHEQLASEINLGEGDLDFLTNAEFFDFDQFHPAATAAAVDAAHYNSNNHSQHHSPRDGAQYQFSEFQTYPTPVTPSNGPANGLHGHYPPQPPHQMPYGAPLPGDKRKQSVNPGSGVPSPTDMEEQSRMAAEEDKRRRNTAASARFRVKKKQREAALEKQAREMTEKVQMLEGKVQQLEMENKWLKGLITDKNDVKTMELALKEKAAAERSISDHTTGVGTADAPADDDSEADMSDNDA